MSSAATSMFERELLGAQRNILDAHSNAQLTQPSPNLTYRSPYGVSNQLPLAYLPPANGPYGLGFAAPPPDNNEIKKSLADVNRYSVLKSFFLN